MQYGPYIWRVISMLMGVTREGQGRGAALTRRGLWPHRTRADTTHERYRYRSLYVSYLDSLSSLLEARLGKDHSRAFTLSLLHWFHPIFKSPVPKLEKYMKEVSKFYELERITSEVDLWCTLWIYKQQQDLNNIGITELIQVANYCTNQPRWKQP